MDRKLQRHRADSLRQHGFLVTYIFAVLLHLIIYKPSNCRFLSQILLLWQPGSPLLKFDWYHWIACPWEPPVRHMHLGDISYTRRVIADFVPNFVAMATGVGRGRICLASFNSPTPKPPAICKDLRDISYIGRVIADFIPNFVAMATGVGRGRICLVSFNSPTPKTPCYMQRSPGYLLYKPSYSRYCPKFRCHGNRGNPDVNLNDAVK